MAITVVLAATVSVLVSDIGGGTLNTHVKVAATNAAKTSLIAAGANCGGAQVTTERAVTAATKMVAGDWIQVCGTNGNAASTNVKISMTDSVANSLAYSYTFTDVAACV